MNEIDVAKVRAETPGCETVIHLNNSGAALMPKPVLAAQLDHLKLEAQIGGYEAADAVAERITGVYESVAKLINADALEVAMMPNATRAWDMAFYAFEFSPGDRILTTEVEYGANYVAYLQVARRSGSVIEVIPSNSFGETSPDALESMIDDRVKLITTTYIPTNSGLVNPAEEIGKIARRYGIPYLLDACQAVGQLPIDVRAIGCDLLSGTGRKYLRGPRGTGFLYARLDSLSQLEPPMIDHFAADWIAPDRYSLRPDARRFEAWDANYANILGLGSAVDYALGWGVPAIWDRITALAEELRERLAAVPGVVLYDIGRKRCGIVSFALEGVDPFAVKSALRTQSINLAVSPPSATLLDAKRRNLPPLLRASIHYYNTSEEIGTLCRQLHALG